LRPILSLTHRRNASQGSLGSGSLDDSSSPLPPILSSRVVDWKTVRDGALPGKSFALYKILVKSRDARNQGLEEHSVYRRYSDFYALHDRVSARYPHLARLPFPSKRAFGNTDNQVLQKRLAMLHVYLQELLKTKVLEQNPGLLEMLQKFLGEASYEKERKESSNVAKAVGSVKSSVKTVSSAVTAVPQNIFNKVEEGVSKVLQVGNRHEDDITPFMLDTKVGASLEGDYGAGDNIPLRITLLLMDEIFDLRERNQWLRRQIVFVLRQIIKNLLGDIVNRRIIDFYTHLTSPSMLGALTKSIRESLWPEGFPAETAPPRDETTKMRTRVGAKVALFASLPDELRRVIGSETSRAGLLVLFDMLQRPVLNKRLVIVALEGFLSTLFDGHDFPSLFARLHARSPRVRNEWRNSQRRPEDLRR